MLPNDNASMSVGYLDHVLIVYSSMEHVTWKSPGPMYGWVGRILHPDSCTSVSSWSKMPLLSIRSVAVPLWRPLLPCPSRWHGSLSRHGLWWLTYELHCSPLPWRLGSVYQLWKSPLLSCVPWSSDQTGLFGGHTLGARKFGVSWRSSSTVARAHRGVLVHCHVGTAGTLHIAGSSMTSFWRREAASEKSVIDITRISCFVTTMKLPHALQIYSTVFVKKCMRLHF